MKEHPEIFNKESWQDFSDEEQATVKNALDFDMSFLFGDQLYRQGIANRRTHDDAVQEMRKFLIIKALRDIHPMGCFGPTVAAAWHAFILDTQRYQKFCDAVYGGIIHHKPSNYGKGVLDNTAWMSVYRQWFGEFPAIWKLDINGIEIPGYEHAMNIDGNVASDDMDSDDGAYP